MVPYVIFFTIDKEQDADNIITVLLQKKYAACCQKQKIKSSYSWQGEVVNVDEIKVSIKTFEHLVPKVEKVCKELHSYEIYELVGCKLDYV
ncbi:hypothetical protein COBT_001944, partial [Conglomerata obtusa]